jgi:hypothetical protein
MKKTSDKPAASYISGAASILVIVLGITVSIIVSGLVLVAEILYTNTTRTENFEKALAVAEAGAQYYRWHLAHNPTDFTDGTGNPGPYIHNLTDPYGNTEGTFSLTIDPPVTGSSIITIHSQGWITDAPDVKRKIKIKYGIPSFAKYTFLTNGNLWFGQKDHIYGKVFSNGGIRMDGTHDSTVGSAKATYICGTETGCDPPETKPGVWGDGGPQALWQYPVSSVDFNSVPIDFNFMKNSAVTDGTYLAASGKSGYHIVFNSDGTYTVSVVTQTTSTGGWSVENGCETLFQVIKKETVIGTYPINTKPIIFAEDTLWVEGVVHGKVTVAAVRFPLEVNAMNIWIPGNITYAAKDGNSSLGIIAQNDIYFGLNIPQEFEVDAALFAQKGRVLRHNYKYTDCKEPSDAVRQELYIYGSVISNLKSYWSYGQGTSGFGSDPVSGFSQREIIYDPTLYYSPPPYFPTFGDYEFISWEEE